MDKIVLAVVAVVTVIALAVILGAVFAFPVMWLWNGCLIPAFAPGAVMEITWVQAWGLLVLSSLLIKSGSSSN